MCPVQWNISSVLPTFLFSIKLHFFRWRPVFVIALNWRDAAGGEINEHSPEWKRRKGQRMKEKKKRTRNRMKFEWIRPLIPPSSIPQKKEKEKKDRGETAVKTWRRRRRDNSVPRETSTCSLHCPPPLVPIFPMNFFSFLRLVSWSATQSPRDVFRHVRPSQHHMGHHLETTILACLPNIPHIFHTSTFYRAPSLYSLRRPLSLPPLLTRTLPLATPRAPFSPFMKAEETLLTCMGQWLFGL